MINKNLLPNNVELEKSLLCGMINFTNIQDIALARLKNDDFFLESHQIIFQAMCDLNKRGNKIDFYTLSQELLSTKKLDIIGGNEYLYGLLQVIFIKEKINELIDILQKISNLRSLLKTMNNIEDDYLHKFNGDYVEFVAKAQKIIDEIAEQRKISNFVSSKEIVLDMEKYIFSLIETNKIKEFTGLNTKFRKLNDCTNGLQKQNLIIIAGRTGLGKTALVLNLMLNIALTEQIPIAMFEMEMSIRQLYMRLISNLSYVEMDKIAKGNIDDLDKSSIKSALNVLSKLEIYVDESSSLTILDLIAKARKLKKECPNLGLIVVDYLGLISSENKQKRRYENRQLEIQEYTRMLHELARELDLTILLLCQLNRKVEDRGNGIPRLSDLRESGSIEQDAEMVLLLHRDDYGKNELTKEKMKKNENGDNNENDDLSEMNIIVAKNRHGKSDYCFSLIFDKKCGRLQDPTYDFLINKKKIVEKL